MKGKEKFTSYDKRKLTYDRTRQIESEPSKSANPLDLPSAFEAKISGNQYKRLKEAFFIEASLELKLSRPKFPVVMRSLGIIQKTHKLYQIFDELEEKEMKWFDFLQAYVALRGAKGSYNELANAVYDLDKEYRGNWDEMFLDMQKYGDVLSGAEVESLRRDICKGKAISTEGLINGLLYER